MKVLADKEGKELILALIDKGMKRGAFDDTPKAVEPEDELVLLMATTSTSSSSTTSTTSSSSSSSSTSSTASTSSTTSSTTSTTSTTTTGFPVQEVWQAYKTGQTLYFCRFNVEHEVLLSNGASSETWGTAGRDADDYDVPMTEHDTGAGQSRFYAGDFDVDKVIGAGTYRVIVYLQAGANPADTDTPVGQGEIYWDGSSEVNPYTLYEDIQTINSNQLSILNIYDERGDVTLGGVYPTVISDTGGVYP